MKFKLVENFSGQTALKWEIIKTSIDKNIAPLTDDDLNDCRHATIHHINSNHEKSDNNLMLIPNSIHSRLTRDIEKAISNSMGGDQRAISVKTTLDFVRGSSSDFAAIQCPYGVMIVWKRYLYTDGKPRPNVKLVDLNNAMQIIEKGYNFTIGQISIDDYMKTKKQEV